MACPLQSPELHAAGGPLCGPHGPFCHGGLTVADALKGRAGLLRSEPCGPGGAWDSGRPTVRPRPAPHVLTWGHSEWTKSSRMWGQREPPGLALAPGGWGWTLDLLWAGLAPQARGAQPVVGGRGRVRTARAG